MARAPMRSTTRRSTPRASSFASDTRTNRVKTYTSARGKLFQTFFDTAAFFCP